MLRGGGYYKKKLEVEILDIANESHIQPQMKDQDKYSSLRS